MSDSTSSASGRKRVGTGLSKLQRNSEQRVRISNLKRRGRNPGKAFRENKME